VDIEIFGGNLEVKYQFEALESNSQVILILITRLALNKVYHSRYL